MNTRPMELSGALQAITYYAEQDRQLAGKAAS